MYYVMYFKDTQYYLCTPFKMINYYQMNIEEQVEHKENNIIMAPSVTSTIQPIQVDTQTQTYIYIDTQRCQIYNLGSLKG